MFTVEMPLGNAHLPRERLIDAAGQRAHAECTRRRLRRRGAGLAAGCRPWRRQSARPDGNRPGVSCSPTTTPTCATTRAGCSPSSYDVEAVADGEAALEAARARRPDLVVTDVMMPNLDGFGLIRALRDDPDAAHGARDAALGARRRGSARRGPASRGGRLPGQAVQRARAAGACGRVAAVGRDPAARTRGVAPEQRAVRGAARSRAARRLHDRCRFLYPRGQSGCAAHLRRHPGWRRRTRLCRGDAHPVGAAVRNRGHPHLPPHAGNRRVVLRAGARREAPRSRCRRVLRMADRPHPAARWPQRRGLLLPRHFGAGAGAQGTRVHAEKLREADRRKDEFLATLSHELRNPLAPLRNALQLMRHHGDDTAAMRRCATSWSARSTTWCGWSTTCSRCRASPAARSSCRRERVELSAVVRNAVETSEPLIQVGPASSRRLTCPARRCGSRAIRCAWRRSCRTC